MSSSNPSNIHDLVLLREVDPAIAFDVRYATTNNFTGRVLYDCGEVYLSRRAAERLKRVSERLRPLGLRLKVYDGYRPLSVQKKLWAIVPDENYVANPAKGSRHNRGCSVDLTLIDERGEELEMPTPYDDFSERAHIDSLDVSREAMANHFILMKAMTAEGYIPLRTEWWHFDAPGWEQHPILDVDPCELSGVE